MLLSLNGSKIKVMLFENASAREYPNIHLRRQEFEPIGFVKYLGVEIRCKLK